MYNDIIFKKSFAPTETNFVTLHTNATETLNISTWLNDTKFDQLHHVVVDEFVMFTSNVSIAKSIVNDATIMLTSVHINSYSVATNIGVQLIRTPTQFFFCVQIFNTNIHTNDTITKHHFQ